MNLKKHLPIIAPLTLAGILASSAAQAVDISLFDWAINIDGTVSEPFFGDPIPGNVNVGGFDDFTGLGTISVTMTGAGAHTFDAFFDHEIDENINGFFNETGATGGVAKAGQSWEIDEPGFINGDIFENFQASLLDNGIGTSIYGNTLFPEDVSMAMGWDFSLGAGETALIELVLSEVAPTSGFYLEQFDPDSGAGIYLSSTLTIRGGPAVPEPGMLWLMGAGLAGFAAVRRRRS